jgi:ABC-type transport system substrate-binding protein
MGNRTSTVLWALAAVATLCAASAGPAFAQSAVKLKGEGQISLSTDGPSTFSLSGTASHLGEYTCYGELDLLQGTNPGLQSGEGVAVFEAANGDLLVGIVTYQLNGNGAGEMTFSWRDSVQFSDGQIIYTTGRFVKQRPPGAVVSIQYNLLVVIAIIAILIG